MNAGLVIRLVCLTGVALATLADAASQRLATPRARTRRWLAAVALVYIAITIALWINHVPYPLHLDLMEGVVLQHARLAAAGLPLYPVPTAAYVPLAYNPLFYYLAAPVVWLVGPSIAALRLVAIAGTVGSAAAIFAAVRDRTKSAWWALFAVGAFAAAYRVMDTYLDTAHSDSWLLCCALLGSYAIDRAQGRLGRIVGVVLLVLAFWFKQHGALFAIGGLLYLTWRGGWRASAVYWLLGVVLGPLVYLAAVQWPFGPAFHYFTWEVPRGWSRLDWQMMSRLSRFIFSWYPLAALASVAIIFEDLRDPRRDLSIWDVQFVAAAGSAAMGAMDWGSATNVFVPFGAFTLVLASIALARFEARARTRLACTLVPLGAAFVLLPLVYDPRRAMVPSRRAAVAYADLVATVRSLGAPVYAPDIGQAPDTDLFSPAEHWIALEDLGRGPGHTQEDRNLAWHLLDPVTHPAGPAYLLTETPVDQETPPVRLLSRYYALERDFGERFAALGGPPKLAVTHYPRYLYRYVRPSTDTAWLTPYGIR
jgi:hypothetical protein